MAILTQAVAPNTQRSYSGVKERWGDFMTKKFPAIDLWLTGLTNKEQRVVLISYMKMTVDDHRRLDTEMGGLRHLFRVNLADLNIFDDGVVQGARRSLKPRGRDVCIRTEQRMRAPFTVELLRWARTHYWNGGADEKMTYLGAALQYALVWRISELISDEHGLLTEDVVYVTSTNEHVLAPQLSFHMFSSVKMIQVISRSSKTRASRGKTEVICREDPDSDQLVLDLMSWAGVSGVQNGNFFLSRFANGRNKRLTRGMVTNLVKASATHFNLPVSRYSSHSLRIGGPTEMLAAGVSSSEILLASGHESNAGLLYQLNSARVRKPLQVVGSTGVGLSSAETLAMMPGQVESSRSLILRFPASVVQRTKLSVHDQDDSSVREFSEYQG